MIDVYGFSGPNIMKVHIALEETGLPYKSIEVNVLKSDQFTPEFTALNPNQKIPVIVDHDGYGGKPFTLFESGAILLYISEKTGKLVPADPEGRMKAIQWLFQQHGGMGPMGGQLAHFYRFAPKGLNVEYSEKRYRSENNRLYDLYDSQLALRPYIAGDSFTIADIAIWPWIGYHELHNLDLNRRKHLKAWYDKIAERESVKRVQAAYDGRLMSNSEIEEEASSPDALDRFFRRGKYLGT